MIVVRGTPPNIFQAIKNGIEEIQERQDRPLNAVSLDDLAWMIRFHVKDYLAQKFQAAKFLAHQNNFNSECDLQLLFDACTAFVPPAVTKETNND